MSRLPISLSVAAAVMLGGVVNCGAETSSSEPVGIYHLKRKSSFNAPEDARAPFWPIGHVKRSKTPEAPTSQPVVPQYKLDPEMFSVTSIVLGNPSLAIINGRAYGEGEVVRMPKAAAATTKASMALHPSVRVRVMRIQDGQVVLQAQDGQSVSVGLKRPELPQHQNAPAELLLDQDR